MPETTVLRTMSARIYPSAEQRKTLLTTLQIFNASVDAVALLLRSVLNGKFGSTSDERLQLQGWLRAIFALKGSVNYVYFLSKAACLAKSTGSALSSTAAARSFYEKQLANEKVSAATRASAQKALEDLKHFNAAMDRFATGWYPLEEEWALLKCGLRRNIVTLSELCHAVREEPTSGKWFEEVVGTAVERLKSDSGLYSAWKSRWAEWLDESPAQRAIGRLLSQGVVPSRYADLVRFISSNGDALAGLFGQTFQPLPTKPDEVPTETRKEKPLDRLLQANPWLKDVVPTVQAGAKLLAEMPTTTRCDAAQHPVYPVLTAPQSGGMYNDLTLKTHRTGVLGSVSLSLLQEGGMCRETLLLRADSRLANFEFAARPAGDKKANIGGTYTDKSFGVLFDASRFRGARLRSVGEDRGPNGELTAKAFYLDFSIEFGRQGGRLSSLDPDLSLVLSPGHLAGLRSDYGLFVHGAEATVLQEVVFEPKNENASPKTRFDSPFDGVKEHDDELVRRTKETKRLVRGEQFSRKLRDHVRNSLQDTMRKSANQVVRAAWIRGASTIVLPDLSGVNPSRFRDAEVNRLFRARARGAWVSRIKQIAERVGIEVVELRPFGLGRVCSKCSHMGDRARISEQGVAIDQHGALFVCSNDECARVTPALKNDAEILTERFAQKSAGREERPSGFTDYLKLDASARRTARERTRTNAMQTLETWVGVR